MSEFGNFSRRRFKEIDDLRQGRPTIDEESKQRIYDASHGLLILQRKIQLMLMSHETIDDIHEKLIELEKDIDTLKINISQSVFVDPTTNRFYEDIDSFLDHAESKKALGSLFNRNLIE